MKADVITLGGENAGSIDLSDALFGLDPRADILHRVVRWQRAKSQAGTHDTKGRSEVSYSTKKIYRQKGTGGARHGDKGAPIFRHGGTYKGPTPRSHAHDLPKKFRALGLRHALSAKAKAGDLVILDTIVMAEAKSSILAKMAKELGWKRVLVIDGSEVDGNFAPACRNIEGIDVLPTMGANVYDILKRDQLVITKAGVEALEMRLGKSDAPKAEKTEKPKAENPKGKAKLATSDAAETDAPKSAKPVRKAKAKAVEGDAK